MPTLQGTLDEALSKVFRQQVRTVGASRTDSGVHARGQVCHFKVTKTWGDSQEQLEPETALRRLQNFMPAALLVLGLGHAVPAFHARLSATGKRYSYRLALARVVAPLEARSCWRCGGLDVSLLEAAAQQLDGKKMDYSAFTLGWHV